VVLDGVQHQPHALLAFAQSPLHVLALRNVDDRGDDLDPIGGLNGVERDFEREFAAILAQAVQIVARAHRPPGRSGQESGAMRQMGAAKALGQQHVDAAAEQLVAAITERPFGLDVHQFDDALAVDHDHRGRRGFED